MSRRQDFYKTLQHKTPSRVLLDLCGCPLSGLSPEAEQSLCEHLSIAGNAQEKREQLLRHLDIDTRGVGSLLCPPKSLYRRISPTSYLDEWGVRRDFTGLYWDIVNAPLADATLEDLETYPWPDPDSIPEACFDAFVRKAKYLHEETDYVICAEHPVYGIFELGCWMCGFEEFLSKMLLDEPFVRRFFEIILSYQKKIIQRYYPPLAPYIDYTSSGDDFATQTNLFISPDLFASLVAPYFKARIDYTKQYMNAAYLHHSCGNVSSLIPQLIDCGVQILNPIQPTGSAMQPSLLKAQFGHKVVFHGGCDTQAILPTGSPSDVRKAVNDLLQVMQKDGGYIFAAAHNLQGDIPPENIVEMFKTARQFAVGGQ